MSEWGLGMQIIVLVITLVLMAVVGYLFWAAAHAGQPAGEGADGRRRALIWGLLVIGAVVSVATLIRWPHSVASDSAQMIMVNATGAQWSWEIDVTEIPAGRPVVFNVHAADVNHGLGVYDPDNVLLFQTQAMPGYVNRVKYTFETPGRYQVLCLEFCGLAHHEMMAEFDVVAATGGGE